jgi:hypothetical protein
MELLHGISVSGLSVVVCRYILIGTCSFAMTGRPPKLLSNSCLLCMLAKIGKFRKISEGFFDWASKIFVASPYHYSVDSFVFSSEV